MIRITSDPVDLKESIEHTSVMKQFREMYLLIRALHVLSKPGSEENEALIKFFEEIITNTWVDLEQAKKLLIKGQVLIVEICKAENKENIPPTTHTEENKENIPLKEKPSPSSYDKKYTENKLRNITRPRPSLRN